MADLSKNIDNLVRCLKDKEVCLREKGKFCRMHNFQKEEEWLKMQYNIVVTIRFEVEHLKSDDAFLPILTF